MTGGTNEEEEEREARGGGRETLFLLGVVLAIMGPIVGLFVFVGPAAGAAWFMVIPTLFFGHEAHRVFQRSRRFADVPTARLRSAAQGYVELSGRLDTGGGTAFPRSPISDTPCHYWHLELVRRRRQGEGNNRWHSVKRMASARTFLPFEDGTGSAYLMIHDLFFTPRSETCIAFPSLTRLRARTPADLEALRDRVPAALLKAATGDGPWQVVERVLPADQPLFVTGLLRTINSNASPTLRSPWGGLLQGGDKTAWEAEMRRLEGVGPKASLRGGVRVNVVTMDSRTASFSPLILASRHDVEGFLIRAHWREAAQALLGAAIFLSISLTAAAIAVDPAVGEGIVDAIRAPFGG
ncbi:hypothetical protein ACM64Y_19900 [Novispirillum sp. DQ9]|uniref:hypothetical protein n=1 Tax=Novispirillum sp. DQ9 TaxID=3398612 RepID=UPI003C7B5952